MRFGLLTEGETPQGLTHYHRYHEVIEEVEFADSLGFDFFGSSEQHFLPTFASISAPETLYAAIAMRTSRIKIRHLSVLMLSFNHPIRVAERLATLDIISDGRVELCTARSNSPLTLDAFGIDPNETREMWREGLEITVRALVEDPFEFKGKYYTIPPRSIVPKLYREEMFPVSVIGTSQETFTIAGNAGLGVQMNDNWAGWGYIEQAAKTYKEAIKTAEPFAPYPITDSLGFCSYTVNCDRDIERAYNTARHAAEGFCALCYEALYMPLVQRSGGYSDFQAMQDCYDHRDDIDFIMSKTPSCVVGGPDKFIETATRLEQLGFDEFLLRIDGFGHEQNMRAIETVGKYVIPHFKAPKSPVIPGEYADYNVEVPKYVL